MCSEPLPPFSRVRVKRFTFGNKNPVLSVQRAKENEQNGIRHTTPPPWVCLLIWGKGGLGLVRGTGGGGLIVAAVHLLLHGAVLLQLLAGEVGDLQEAAGLHHHVGLAGVRQDGVLRDDLQKPHQSDYWIFQASRTLKTQIFLSVLRSSP